MSGRWLLAAGLLALLVMVANLASQAGTRADACSNAGLAGPNAYLNAKDHNVCHGAARKLIGLEVGPWTQEGEGAPRKRVVTYMTAPSALVKSVKATETYTYTRADAGGYIVELSVATPDVPYGNCFLTELQFSIAPVDGKSHRRM